MRVSNEIEIVSVDVWKNSCYYQINYDPPQKIKLVKALFTQAQTRVTLVDAWYWV